MSLRAQTLTVIGSTRLFTETCYTCGVLFGMDAEFQRNRLNDHKVFYCPSGHGQSYLAGQSDADKLRDSKARETALKDQLVAAVRDGETTRAAMLRDRSRFAAGVCPCCNRSFENVRRHMSTKHPDYDVDRIARAIEFKCSCGRKFETYQGLRIHQGRGRAQTAESFGEAWDDPETGRYWQHLTEVKVR